MQIGRLLVTGAAGFLGSIIVRQAVNADLLVTATDKTMITPYKGVDFIPAEILDPVCLSKIFEGVDCVCHAAGLAHIFSNSEATGAQFHAVNVIGTENLISTAVRARVKHFVFISSVSVYGGVAHGKDENSECHPESPYAKSKLLAERRLIKICKKERINLTILRLTTLYGEGDPGNVARLIGLINRRRFIWIGKGENFKSLIHCEDAAKACISVIKAPMSGINIYNVSAPPYKMRDIVTAIALELKKPIAQWHIPESVALSTAKILKSLALDRGKLSTVQRYVEKWLNNDFYCTDKFFKTYNFQTKISLKEGIKREVNWYKASIL